MSLSLADASLPEPPAYLRALARHFQTEEPGLWRWFSSAEHRAGEAESVRLDLLKSTYRLDAQSQAGLHQMVGELRDAMGITGTITLYQGPAGELINASVAYLPGEAHIVLCGPVLTALDPGERRALLAHELAHFLLLDGWLGEFRIVTDLVRNLAIDTSAGPEYGQSQRLISLYTEIFADRWALRAGGDLGAAVRTLVKSQTGLADVSADSYLRQAAEIFEKGPVQADGHTHPEPFIRARAMSLWHEHGSAADDDIALMIEGPLAFSRLDLLGQKRVSELTRRFIETLLAPAWFRTEGVLAHARQFFPDISPADSADDRIAELAKVLEPADAALRDYFAFVLLDFVSADRDLGDPGLAAAFELARRLGLEQRFTELAQKELVLTKKAITRISQNAESILASVGSPLAPREESTRRADG